MRDYLYFLSSPTWISENRIIKLVWIEIGRTELFLLYPFVSLLPYFILHFSNNFIKSFSTYSKSVTWMHDEILPYNLNSDWISLGMSSWCVITAGFKSMRKEAITTSFFLLLLARCQVRDGTLQLRHSVGQMELQGFWCDTHFHQQVWTMDRTCSSPVLGLPHSHEFKHPVL